MNIDDKKIEHDKEHVSEEYIEALIPTKKAYLIGFFALFASSLSGGLIGYACSKIFVNNPSFLVDGIFAVVSTISIGWAMSIVVGISLKASVEFNARKKLFPSKKRPSKLLKQ